MFTAYVHVARKEAETVRHLIWGCKNPWNAGGWCRRGYTFLHCRLTITNGVQPLKVVT